MTSSKRVAIIGAGISGLAHADVLTRCGFSVVLFERAERIGGVWACAYPDVSLQNTRSHYHLSSFPWPFVPDEHPTGAQVLRYLDAVVTARKFDIRLRSEVVAAREAKEGGWSVRVRGPSGDVPERFDHLVVSIGQYTEGKHRPKLEGEAEFSGLVITEREIGDLARFDGKRVVVVGFGKSALDMATFAAPRAASVHHVFRTPRWTVPRRILGLHFENLLFNRFGSVMMTSWAHPTAGERLLHRQQWIVGGFWAGLQRLITHIIRHEGSGHGAAGEAKLAKVIPEHPLLLDLRSAAALASPGYYAHVASGAIEPRRAEVAGFTRTAVRLSIGEEVPADVVVLSTGSRSPQFPFLDDDARAHLESEDDGVQLYRHIIHPRLPRLAFAGFNHGFLHVPAAEVGALWLAALWRGELELPSVERMEQDIEHIRAWKRANIHFEPSRSCAINTRFQQYLDIMLSDLGISPYRKLPNPLAEIFSPYGPADYVDVVDEHLRQSPGAPRVPVGLPT